MKFKNTYILAVVALCLGLYVYFIEIKKTETDELAKANSEKIFNFDGEKVKSLKLKNTHGEFYLEKDGSNWKLKTPVQDDADSVAVSSLVNSLTSEKFDQVVAESGADLKVYGLDKPTHTFELGLNDGKKAILEVGSDAALYGKIYVKKGDESKVLFAASNLKTQGEKSLKDLRDKRIFRKNKDDVAALKIKFQTDKNKSEIEMAKVDGHWKIEKPIAEKGDGDAITGFVNQIDGVRAEDFVSESGNTPAEVKKYGLNRPEMEFVLLDKDKKVISKLLVSGKKDNKAQIIVEGQPTIYQVPSAGLDLLVKSVDDFRDKKVGLDFKKDGVREISVKTELAELDLIKKDSGWELKNPDKKKTVNQMQVTSLLDRLSQLKVSEFLKNEAPKGLNKPKGKVELKDEKGTALFELVWGEKTKSQKAYYVKSSLAQQSFGIETTQLDSLPVQTLVETPPEPAKEGSAPPISKSESKK